MSRPVEVGPWRVTALSDGTMRLDGGAMWGVVPRVLWELLTPPAADNTIPVALRPEPEVEQSEASQSEQAAATV